MGCVFDYLQITVKAPKPGAIYSVSEQDLPGSLGAARDGRCEPNAAGDLHCAVVALPESI